MGHRGPQRKMRCFPGGPRICKFPVRIGCEDAFCAPMVVRRTWRETMVRMTTQVVDVHADTAVERISMHETLEDAHAAAQYGLPAGWVLWDFAVSDECDDECSALVVRG